MNGISQLRLRGCEAANFARNVQLCQYAAQMLHKCALNIIRIHKRETQSKLPLNGIMFSALMNPHALLPLLGKT